jgi:hypothetical protein
MRIEFEVDLKPVRGLRRISSEAPAALRRPPALLRLLVLAHQIEQAVAEGRARDYVEVARQLHLTRARVTQIVSLLRLSPSIQQIIITEPQRVCSLSERQLRPIAREIVWDRQRTMFENLLEPSTSS